MDIKEIVNSLSEAESKAALTYFLKSYTSPAFGHERRISIPT
ncbi:MAG: hypothetical protein ACJAXJ_001768 [Colwellia sp.]|jgi:hypothetical protein